MSNKTNGREGVECLLTARICVNEKINDFSICRGQNLSAKMFSVRQTRLVDTFAKLPFHLMEIEDEERQEENNNRFLIDLGRRNNRKSRRCFDLSSILIREKY